MFKDFLLFLAAVITGFAWTDYVIVRKAKRLHSWGKLKGYHVHHSVYGVGLLLFTPFTLNNVVETLLLTGFGLGIISEHTLREGFIFITRETRKK